MTERSKRNQRELQRAKNAVRGAFNKPKASYLEFINRYGKAKLSPSDLILGGFSHLTANDAEAFLEWVKGFPSKTVQVYPSQPVQKASELFLQNVTIEMPLLARLNWLSTLLEQSTEELSDFVGLADSFEAAYLSGSYENAQSVLDEILKKYGFSVWLIENQISLIQRWKGLDAQKEYSKSISSTSRGRVAGVSAYWISQRNEESTVFTRYAARLETRMETWPVSEALKDAFSLILGITTFEKLPDARASSALASLASTSVVDAYATTVLAVESVLTGGKIRAEQIPLLTSVVLRLPSVDVRIRNIISLLAEDPRQLPAACLADLDNLCGEPTRSSAASGAPDATELLDHALLKIERGAPQEERWPKHSPVHDLYDLVETAIRRPQGFEARLDQGEKLLTNVRHLRVGAAVKGFLSFQSPQDPLGQDSLGTRFYLNSRYVHPWHAYVLPCRFAIALCEESFSASPSAKLIALALKGELSADKATCIAVREIAARSYLARGENQSALSFLEVSNVTVQGFERRRLVPLQVTAYMRLQRLADAISASASVCAVDPDIAALIPLREIVDQAQISPEKIDPLSLAIIFDLYLERFDNADIFQRLQFAYEDYILKQGVERPSELVGRTPAADTFKLIFYLRTIAIPQVMDVSFWLFKSSRETLTERIAVCSALIELDPANEATYREEIKDVTKLLSIQDGLDDVDRSRVFINLSKLQRWAELELRESFERYKALLRAGVHTEASGDFDKALKDYAAGKASLDQFINYPNDESSQLLLDMFKAVSDKYLHDADFGLDAYLSMRIRHGSLAGHIRGPLEEQGLLAVRDHGTNQYRMLRRPNVEDHWADIGNWDTVDECVKTFSGKFDALIDGLVKKKLQIKQEGKLEGLFVFDPTPLFIYYLRANLDEGSTFNDFLGRVIDAQDVYLSISLQNVSRYVTQEFGDAVGKCLEEFREEIDSKVNLQLSAELQTLIGKASPELQASIDRVASWFALDEANERRTLRTMEQIVDIAIQATNNAHRGFDPQYSLDVQDLGLQANDIFLEFTDILFTILDNIYAHSGLDQKPIIEISIKEAPTDVDDGGTRVRISVVNKIAAQKKSSANEKRLNRIRENIDSGNYRAFSKVEGGTGLLKLKRIVAADSRQTLDFGYRPDRLEFFVEITMVLVFTPAQVEAAA